MELHSIIQKVRTYPPHEHRHEASPAEGGLAVIIIVLLVGSLLSERVINVPHYITPLLIALFIALKVGHILKKGGSLLEDYASIGVVGVFFVLYLILRGTISVTLTTAFIVILFYSAGLSLWVRSNLGSSKLTHFIISYGVTVIMIIFLFAGAYSSRDNSFMEQGKTATLSYEDALYFSAVTFTTVGYGDIVPIGINRGLAAIEALIGTIVNIALMGYVLSSSRFKERE